MARPQLQIDENLLESLASIGCTNVEMALILGCSDDTLVNRFSDLIEKGRANMKESLRRKQFKAASDGNIAMLIWLGKQHLGQREPTTASDWRNEVTQFLNASKADENEAVN